MKLRWSCYNSEILKKLVIVLKIIELFHFHLGGSKEEEIFFYVEHLLKLGVNCGVWEQTVASLPTAVHLAEVSAVRLTSYNKLMGEGWSFSPLAGTQQERLTSWLCGKLL